MRVSIRRNDSGYSLHRHLSLNGQRALVTLNGEHEPYAITADDEANVVVRYKKDLEFDVDREDYVDEVVHGKVEIEVVDEMVL